MSELDRSAFTVQRLQDAVAECDAVAGNHQLAFASSLAAEDMVLTDLIWRNHLPINIFTLNTGRLHAETVAMIDRVQHHYGQVLHVFTPNEAAVMDYVATHGKNAFYESVELRKSCCHIRKVEPLDRALRELGQVGWVTGQRQEQSVTRADLPWREQDTARGLIKFNPLTDWTHEEIWAYIRANDVPYNPLHDRGYPSIGCEPCTRAIKAGEDLRAGRWWWESSDSKECGLHGGNVSIKN
jgi:phosphoadenosine phosphosulfate reductase